MWPNCEQRRARPNIFVPHLETDLILPKSLESFPTWVTKSAAKSVKQAVEKLAIYFHREMGYDFVQYAANDHDDKCVVYTWDERCFVRSKGEMGFQMFGAACFRYGQRMGGNFEGWFLVWVWFHPYFRSHGYLSRAWPRFLERFNRNFIPEWPYSAPIKSLLRKHVTPEQIEVFANHGDAEKYITDNWKEDSIMPVTSVSIAKFVPEELQNLVLRFFVCFSRFECALKRAGYTPAQGAAHADWDNFANHWQNGFQPTASPLLAQACDYFEQRPPLRQISDNGQLSWSPPEFRGE
jgi:hypothetical protein